MNKLPESVVIIFAVISVLGFLLRFIKDGTYKQLSIKPLVANLGIFALVFLPFLGLLFLASHFAVLPAGVISYFAAAACLSYLLSGINLPSYLRGIILGGASVALTCLAPVDFISLAGALTGLLTVKLTENIGYGGDSNLDDVLPPLTWLTAVMWLTSIDSPQELPKRAAVILGVMAVSIFMRFVQGPFVFVGKTEDDKIMVKRVVLACTAGLGVLCIVVKLLNLMQYQNLALLCGAGYFLCYLYKDLNGEDRYSLPGQQALRLLVFVGALTLVAMRFYGTFGLLALAATGMLAPLSTAGLFPALYFGSRALLQVYLQHFNQNVTGINLTHPYAGAAQYGGFLLGIAMLLLLKEKIERKLLLALALSACIITPVLSNFVLHSEATCSLFVATVSSCFLLAVVGPALQGSSSKGAENITLAPALMISSGILTSGLLELGNSATISVKTTVLSYGVVFVVLLAAVFWFFFQRKNKTPATPATANGE